MAKFFPSEIARLVLGYLRDLPCPETHQKFLVECPHLQEYYQLLQEGETYHTDVNGKSLVEILKEYCLLKRESLNNSSNTIPSNSSSSNANRHVPAPTPIVNPDSSNSEGFKTPCKSNQIALVKHRSAQKSQTQSVTTTLRYQAEVHTPRLNLSSRFSSQYTPRRLTGVVTTPLNFTGETTPHRSSTLPTPKRTVHSDPVPKKSHRFVQTEISANDPISHTSNALSANAQSTLQSNVQNSEVVERETVDKSNSLSTIDSLPNSFSNRQFYDTTSAITTSESVTLTLESSLTPQYNTDPPPYARAPATNSPRLILSLDRSQVPSLTTPMKQPRNWTEETASPKRKGLIPRRRLLSESPNPKNFSDDLNSIFNEEDLAEILKAFQSVPTAQMIADNINKVADFNLIYRPEELAKNLNTDKILDDICMNLPISNLQVQENLENQTDRPSTSSYYADCPQSAISINSFTEEDIGLSQTSNEVNNYQPNTINTPKEPFLCAKISEENFSLPHYIHGNSDNQSNGCNHSRNISSDSTTHSLNQEATNDNAVNSENNNQNFSSLINTKSPNKDISDSNPKSSTQMTSVLTSAEIVSSVITSAAQVTPTAVSAAHVSSVVTSSIQVTSVITPASQAIPVVTSAAQATTLVSSSEQITPVAHFSDSMPNDTNMECDEIQIIKEIPPTPKKIKPPQQTVQYITTNILPEQNISNNCILSGVNLLNNSYVTQSDNSIPQTFYILPNGQYLIPNPVQVNPTSVQSNVSYKIILPLNTGSTGVTTPADSVQNSSSIDINSSTTSEIPATSSSPKPTLSSNNKQSSFQGKKRKKGNNMKRSKSPTKRTKINVKSGKISVPYASSIYEPDIPVISIPEPSPSKAYSMDALDYFFNITGNNENLSPVARNDKKLSSDTSNDKEKSPIWNQLVSSVSLFMKQSGNHVKRLDFGQDASAEINVKSPEASKSLKSMPEICVENRRSSPRLKQSNVKSQFKNLKSCSQKIPELTKGGVSSMVPDLEESKNNSNVSCKSSFSSSNTTITKPKTAKQTSPNLSMQNTASFKEAVLNAMTEAITVSNKDDITKSKSSSEKKHKARSVASKIKKAGVDLTKGSSKTKCKSASSFSNKTATTHKQASDQFFPSSDSESESENIPLSSLTASKSLDNVSSTNKSLVNNCEEEIQVLTNLPSLKDSEALGISENVLSSITENNDLLQDEYDELPALPFEACIGLSKNSEGSMDVVALEGSGLKEIKSPLKFSDARETVTTLKSNDSIKDNLVDLSSVTKPGDNLSTLIVVNESSNQLEPTLNENVFEDSNNTLEKNDLPTAVIPGTFKDKKKGKSPRSESNVVLNSRLKSDDSHIKTCSPKELKPENKKNKSRLFDPDSESLNKEKFLREKLRKNSVKQSSKVPKENLISSNQYALISPENELVEGIEKEVFQVSENAEESIQLLALSQHLNEKQPANVKRSRKNSARKTTKEPIKCMVNSDRHISEQSTLSSALSGNLIEELPANLSKSKKNSKKEMGDTLDSISLPSSENELLNKNTIEKPPVPIGSVSSNEKQSSNSRSPGKNSAEKKSASPKSLLASDQCVLAPSENELTSENVHENTLSPASNEKINEKQSSNLKRLGKNPAQKTAKEPLECLVNSDANAPTPSENEWNKNEKRIVKANENTVKNTPNDKNDPTTSDYAAKILNKENSFSLIPSSNVLHKTDRDANFQKQFDSSNDNKISNVKSCELSEIQTNSDSLSAGGSSNAMSLKPLVPKVNKLEYNKAIEAKASRLEGIADKLKLSASSPCKNIDKAFTNKAVGTSLSTCQSSQSDKINQDACEPKNSKQDKFLPPPKKRIRPVPIPSPRDSNISFSPFHAGESPFHVNSSFDSNPNIVILNENSHEKARSSDFKTLNKEADEGNLINNLSVSKKIQNVIQPRKILTGKPKAMTEFYKKALPERESDIPISPDTVSSSSCTLETFLVRKNLSNKFVLLDNDMGDSNSYSILSTEKEIEEMNKLNEPLDMSVNCSNSTSTKYDSPVKNYSREKRKVNQPSPVLSSSDAISNVLVESNCISSENERSASGSSPLKKKMKMLTEEITIEHNTCMEPSVVNISHSALLKDIDDNCSDPSEINATIEQKLQDLPKSLQDSNIDKTPLPSDNVNENNYEGDKLCLLPIVSAPEKFISSNKSPVRSFSPSRNAVKKSALSQRTERNPKIPSGVKIPSKWDTSKISHYSKAIEDYKESSKVSKEKNIEDKKASSSKEWKLRISPKSPKKSQSDALKKDPLPSKRDKKTKNSKDSKWEKSRSSPRKSKKQYKDMNSSHSSSRFRKTPTPHKPIHSYKYRDRTKFRPSEKKVHSPRKRSKSPFVNEPPAENSPKDANSRTKSTSSSKRKDKNDRYSYEVIPLSKAMSNRNIDSQNKFSDVRNAFRSHPQSSKAVSPNKSSKISATKSSVSFSINETLFDSKKSSLEEGEIPDEDSVTFVQNCVKLISNTNPSHSKERSVEEQSGCLNATLETVNVENPDINVPDERTPEDELELQQAILSLTNSDHKFNSLEDVVPNDSFNETNVSAPSKSPLKQPVIKRNLQLDKKLSPTTFENKISGGDEKSPSSYPTNTTVVNITLNEKVSKQKTVSGLNINTPHQQNICASVDSSSEIRTKELNSLRSNSPSVKKNCDSPIKVSAISSTSSSSKKKKVKKKSKVQKPVDANSLMQQCKLFGVAKLLEMLQRETMEE